MHSTTRERRRRSVPKHYALGSFILLLLLCTASPSWATASLLFQGLAQTINTGGSITLSSPSGIVVDPAGNTFIADTGHSQIVEVDAYGVASIITISGLSPALVSPTGIAIDGAGNLYITDADPTNSRLVKVSSSGVGSLISTGSVTLGSPKGVALDQSGDIFIADTGNNRIVEVTPGGSAAALTITVSSGVATLSSPMGLAEDVSGNLYIADYGRSRIVKVAAGSTTGTVISFGTLSVLSNPSGVAVDRIGNIFVADTGNSRIAEVDTAGNGATLLNTNYLQGTELSGPLGVALDVFGGVYIADANRVLVVDPYLDSDPNTAASAYSSSLNKTAVGFGHISLGSSTPTSLILNFSVGSPVSGLGGVSVFTSGTPGLDFQIVTGANTTCSSSTTAGSTCTVEVSFLPTAPGLRRGSLVLYDSAQHPVLTLPLYGFSDAPVAALNPNVGSVISTGTLATANPYEVALDGAGNMYVGVYSGSNVTKIPTTGSSASVLALGTPGTPATAVRNITGVAIDGAGNLFIGDHQNSRILVVTPGGTVSVLSITGLSPVLGFPTTLAFDAAGNLYIADFTNGRIIEVSSLVVSGSTSSGKATVVSTGSYSFGNGNLTGMTVDSMGTVYAAARTQNNSQIVKVTAAGVASLLAIPGNLTPAVTNPQGVGVDAMGNIYIVDTANNRIVRVSNAGVVSVLGVSGLPVPTTLGSTLFGVTVDPSGNLYISDWTNNRIVFVNVSGAALAFPSTAQGATSSVKTATVTNLGNQSLIFSANPTYTANFVSDGNDSNPCTSSTSLLSGILCDVAVDFTPQSVGSLSAGITVTNNSLNVAGSTQQVSVSGTSFSPSDTTATSVTVTPSPAATGQSVTLTATVADTATGRTSIKPTGTVTFVDTFGSTITSLTSTAPSTLSSGKATLSAALSGVGTHTITASYAGVASAFASSIGSTTVTIGKAVPVVTVVASSNPSLPASSVTFTANVSSSTGTPTGTVSFYDGTTLLGTGTLAQHVATFATSSLSQGAHSITATYSGDNSFLTATSAAVNQTVGKTTPVVTVVASANPSLLSSSVTFTANVSSSTGTPTGTVSFYDGATLLGTGTLTQHIATLATSSLTQGAHSITATYGGDNTFSTATSAEVSQTVSDFGVTVPPPSGTGASSGSGTGDTATAAPGGAANYGLQIAPTGTVFAEDVHFTATGLPPGATAVFNPTFIPAGSVVSNVVLTIHLPTQTAELRKTSPFTRTFVPVLAGMLLIPFGGILRRFGAKKVSIACILFALSTVALFGLVGCGGSGSGYTNQKTYVVTVTATSGTLTHSSNLTLIVN